MDRSLVYANRSVTDVDSVYTRYLSRISDITSDRDALVSQIKTVLNAAAFGNQPVSDRSSDRLADRAMDLVERVKDLAEREHDRDHDDRDHHRLVF